MTAVRRAAIDSPTPLHQLLLVGGRDQAVDNAPEVLQGSKNMHIPLFLVHPVGLHADIPLPSLTTLTHAHSVHPGPCNGNPRPISSTSVSSSSSSRYTCVHVYILFVTAAYVSWCSPPPPFLPLVMVTDHSKLGDSGLCFCFLFVC